MMIEYPDPAERAEALARLRGIEDRCYVELPGCGRIAGIADEDLVRASLEKTSAVHWLRFELPEAARAAVKAGGAAVAGTDHPQYGHATPLSAQTIEALARELD
jgi:hypothetical protein